MKRSPVVLPFAPGASEELRCKYDEDSNGLDDEVEEQMARCFAPVFDLDPDENEWQPGEPAILWTLARVPNTEPGAVTVVIKYVALWEKDGGYAGDDALVCGGGDHEGDSDIVRIRATIRQGSHSPVAYLDTVFLWDEEAHTGGTPLMHREGSHPVVFPSAGKHHIYLFPGIYDYQRKSGFWCDDPARGGRRVRLDDVAAFKHGFNPSVTGATLIPLADGSWPNVCRMIRFGQNVPATRFQGMHLDDIGFPGQTYYTFFPESDELTAPWAWLSHTVTVDTDGDGLAEIPFYHAGGVYQPDDPCPLGAQDGPDMDGDNLVGDCDPIERWFSPYVAGGSHDMPAAENRPGVLSAKGLGPAGFLDTDGDDIPDGWDACPFNADWGANSNGWGERANDWGGWAVKGTAHTKLGMMIRGDVCDAYPVSNPSWASEVGSLASTGGLGSSHCLKPGIRTAGTDFVTIAQTPRIGISNNDR